MVAKQVRAAYTQEFRLEVVRLVQSEQSPGAARPATGHHPWACGGAARLSNYRRVCSAHVHASAPAPSCGRPSSLVFSGLQSQALLKMGERRDNITKQQVIDYSSSLADKVARSTATHTVEEIAAEINELIKSRSTV